MKKIKVLALILAAVMMVGMFAACSKHDGRIAGKWVEISDGEEGVTYTFARNGKGTYSEDGFSGDLTWATHKGVLTLTISLCGQTQTSEFRYKISGKTMTLVDVNDPNEVMILKKK